MSGNSRGGNDHLSGGEGNDRLFGDAEFAMRDNARGGNDVLIGADGDDYLNGDANGSCSAMLVAATTS